MAKQPAPGSKAVDPSVSNNPTADKSELPGDYVRWRNENAGALDDYNRRVQSSGVFSSGRRRF
jgi:hypothetical protein